MQAIRQLAHAYFSPGCRVLRAMIKSKQQVRNVFDNICEPELYMMMLDLGYSYHYRIIKKLRCGRSTLTVFVNDDLDSIALRVLSYAGNPELSIKISHYDSPIYAESKVLQWWEQDKQLAA